MAVRTNPPIAQASGYEEDRQKQIEAAVSHPPPPIAYQGLRTGSEFSIEYESNVDMALGFDKSLLRKLSPFVIQVELPQVFESDGALTAPTGGINPNLYAQAGQRSRTTYESARDRLSKTAIVGMNYQVSSGQEYVTMNAKSPSVLKNSGDVPTDVAGNSAGRLGAPAIADVYTAVDIATQLSAALNAPPLVFLLNPDNVTISYSKIQQYTDRSRFGFIFQAWGEDQPKMSISAKCGAFIAGRKGLQFASKRDSAAWQNLMSALHFYKNNGYIYDTIGKSNAHHFIGVLSIHYDQWIYYGHMESFQYAYDENKQNGGLEFSMDFVISMMVDTHQTSGAVQPMRAPTPSASDPRYAGLASQSSNAPGEYSIGVDEEGGVQITTQGRQVSGADGILTMVPEGFAEMITYANPDYQAPDPTEVGEKEQPTGTGGFQPVQEVLSNSVQQVTSGRARPFRRG